MIKNETRIIDLTVFELRQLIRDVNKEIPQTLTPPSQEASDIIGVEEVCLLTHYSSQTIYCFVYQAKKTPEAKNNIPFFKRPGSKPIFFHRTAILQWLHGKVAESEK